MSVTPPASSGPIETPVDTPDTLEFQPAPAPAVAPPPPPPPGSPPRPNLEAEELRRRLELEARGPSIPASIRDPLEYFGPFDIDVTDADTRKVLDVMQPLAIGGEWDDLIVAMAHSSDPCYLDRLTENLCESDNQAQLERFVGWATDERCTPYAKAEIAESLAKQAIEDRPGARDALTRVLMSDPPGSGVEEMSEGELATVAQALVVSGADMRAILDALPEDQRARLSDAIGKCAAGRFHELLPSAGKIVDEMAEMPFGPWDQAVTEMAGRASSQAGFSDLDEVVIRALDQGKFDDLKKWASDPRCSPEAKQAILQSLEKAMRVKGGNLGPGDARDADVRGAARNAAIDILASDPEALGKQIGANPSLLKNELYLEAAAQALTPEMFKTILTEMKATGRGFSAGEGEMEAVGALFKKFIERRGGDDPGRIKDLIAEFTKGAAKAGLMDSAEDFGTVVGGLLSGVKLWAKSLAMGAKDFADTLGAIGDALSLVGAGLVAESAKQMKNAVSAMAAGFKAAKTSYGFLQNPNLDELANKVAAGVLDELKKDEDPNVTPAENRRPKGFANDVDFQIRLMIGSTGQR